MSARPVVLVCEYARPPLLNQHWSALVQQCGFIANIDAK